MTPGRWRWHVFLLALFATAVAVFYLQEPGFGDDFTYWQLAFRLHEQGRSAWLELSFHDLRWPVWIVCWLIQGAIGPGLLSYYGVPVLYLVGGAAISFAFGRLITRSAPVAWGCGIAFLFHPLLDTVSYRPMPDIPEGVWGAAAVLCWWMLMRASSRRISILWVILTGACIFIAEANRVMGAFIVPVLVLCTLLFARRRFAWLIAAGTCAALFYCLESGFYYWLFHDWMHDLHANLGNAGHKGTESIPLARLPTRFLGSFWRGWSVTSVYGILALIGIGATWRRRPPETDSAQTLIACPPGSKQLAQVMAVWMVALYLEYSCSIQSLHPVRPLIRDAERFLCGIAVPMSVLIALGAAWLLEPRFLRGFKLGRWISEHPFVLVALAVLPLGYVTARTRGTFNLGYVPEMRQYMSSRPAGTKVFTDEAMRAFAFLVDGSAARRITWLAEHEIIHRSPALEAEALKADEFWYARKLVWLATRKQLEDIAKGNKQAPPQFASYFDAPERDWTLARVIVKEGYIPDLIFYRRRLPSDPPPLILGPAAPEFAGLFPPLPVEWAGGSRDEFENVTWNVPNPLRGHNVRVEITAGSQTVEPLHVQFLFMHGDKLEADYSLRPYFQLEPAKDFFAMHIPADADHCDIQLKRLHGSKDVKFTDFRAVVEQASESAP